MCVLERVVSAKKPVPGTVRAEDSSGIFPYIVIIHRLKCLGAFRWQKPVERLAGGYINLVQASNIFWKAVLASQAEQTSMFQ